MKAIIHNPSGRRQSSQRLLLKKSAFLLPLVLALSAWVLQAQDAGGPPPGEDGPPSAGEGPQGGPGVGGPGMNPPGGEDEAAGGPGGDQPAAADDTATQTSRETASLARGRALAVRPVSNPTAVGTLTPEARPLTATATAARPSALSRLLAVLDANHDGVIDAEEIKNAVADLKKLDRNGDGKLTREEYLGAPSAEGGNTTGGPDRYATTTSVPPLVAVLDANHDGVIDAGEIKNAAAALKKLDRNGDGKLTRDEYEAAVAPTAGSRNPTAAGTSNRQPRPTAVTNSFAAHAAIAQ